MSSVSQVVMDENLANSTDTYTSQEFNRILSQAKWFAFTVLIDNVTYSTGYFDIWVEESSDGRIWTQRNDTTQATTPPASNGTGDITMSSLTTGNVYFKRFGDACQGVSKQGSAGAGPLLPFVRLHVKTGSGCSCHVRIIYSGRD